MLVRHPLQVLELCYLASQSNWANCRQSCLRSFEQCGLSHVELKHERSHELNCEVSRGANHEVNCGTPRVQAPAVPGELTVVAMPPATMIRPSISWRVHRRRREIEGRPRQHLVSATLSTPLRRHHAHMRKGWQSCVQRPSGQLLQYCHKAGAGQWQAIIAAMLRTCLSGCCMLNACWLRLSRRIAQCPWRSTLKMLNSSMGLIEHCLDFMPRHCVIYVRHRKDTRSHGRRTRRTLMRAESRR